MGWSGGVAWLDPDVQLTDPALSPLCCNGPGWVGLGCTELLPLQLPILLICRDSCHDDLQGCHDAGFGLWAKS